MSAREFDPARIDVAAFAKAGGELQGNWPLRSLDRLSESAVAEALPADGSGVTWRARGELRETRDGGKQVWLQVNAEADVPLACQRCLQAVQVPLAVESSFLFVHGEDAAAQLDADSEHDVLALTRALDLQSLIEDELLLALPIVPRHEVCPEPLALPASGEENVADEKPNPFAALASLRRDKLN